jgi:hypothetical protein
MFFDSQPNFLYPDFKRKGDFKISKNIFRRVRARDSFNAVYSSSVPYTINPGESPDRIALKEFNDPRWYWTILLLNNITDIRSEWPLAPDELDDYIDVKYGDKIDDIRHWETDRITDVDLGIVLDQGVIIEFYQGSAPQLVSGYLPDWSFEYYTTSTTNNVTTQVVNTVTAAQGLTAVTNREYEYSLNENKREIILPRVRYLNLLAEELEKLLAYNTKYKINNKGLRISEPLFRSA